MVSRDRKKFEIEEEASLSFEDLFEALDKGLELGERAYSICFNTWLSLDELSAIWRKYGDSFWLMSSGDRETARYIEQNFDWPAPGSE